jgi:hypothetical protein
VNVSSIEHTTNSSTIGDKQPSLTGSDAQSSNVSADGVGLEKALANFALYYKYEELPGCECPMYLRGRQ